MLKIKRIIFRIIITVVIFIIIFYLQLYYNYSFVIKQISNNFLQSKQNNFTNCFTNLKNFFLKDFLHIKKDFSIRSQLSQKINTLNLDNNIIYKHIFSYGDNLINILNCYGINNSDIVILVKSNPTLDNIKIGQCILWNLAKNGKLNNLIWITSYNKIRNYFRINNSFKEKNINLTNRFHNYLLDDKFISTLVNSIGISNLNYYNTYQILQILKWEFNYSKLKKIDQILKLNLKKNLNRKQVNKFYSICTNLNSKNSYVLRTHRKYYNSSTMNLFHNFMRFPITKKFRISSKFNLHRLNPVTGRITPHLGVDFAVPVGTQILAVGDGKVIATKKNKIAGNYLAIRHNNHYVTRYMHLKKILVKYGQNVRRGDLIALSGNSGRSTGPHLHYEIWINKQAVNPLNIQLLS